MINLKESTTIVISEKRTTYAPQIYQRFDL